VYVTQHFACSCEAGLVVIFMYASYFFVSSFRVVLQKDRQAPLVCCTGVFFHFDYVPWPSCYFCWPLSGKLQCFFALGSVDEKISLQPSTLIFAGSHFQHIRHCFTPFLLLFAGSHFQYIRHCLNPFLWNGMLSSCASCSVILSINDP